MSEQAQAIIQAFSGAIIETVQEAGDRGTPEGPLYAAFMAYGIDLNTFNNLVSYCVRSGKIRKQGFILYPVKKES